MNVFYRWHMVMSAIQIIVVILAAITGKIVEGYGMVIGLTLLQLLFHLWLRINAGTIVQKRRRWSPEEELFLMNNYDGMMSTKDIGAYLGRSVGSIHRKASKLGLRKQGVA